MNYIPGFSNYLETTVPRYAVGGRVMDGEPMMYRNEPMFGDEYNMFGSEMMLPPMDQYAQPMMYGDPMAAAAPVMDTYQQAAVEPMTQEAAPAETAAPYDLSALAGLDLSGLNNLYGMNFGSDFGGGPMGGIYQADPNLQYIGAPLSNKGNATSQTGGNTFAVRADQPVRLVDHRTNQIVFEGTGFDAARKATELGQGLTDQFGRKANYSIQTADPTGNYSTVAYEKKNKSTLGTIADVVGTVAPLALSFVPGFQALTLPLKMAAAAGTGGLGAALKGDDILKGALLGGATAGVVSGTGLDKALGSALGGLSKGAAQGVTQGAAQGLSDEIVVTALSKLAQGAGGAAANALVSNAADAGLSEITGYKTPAEKFAQQQVPQAVQPPVDMYAGIDPIDVLASKALPNYGGALAGVTGPIATDFLPKGGLPEPLPSEPVAQEPYKPIIDDYANVDPIVVTGGGSTTGLDALAGLGNGITASLPALGGLAADPFLSQPTPDPEPITEEQYADEPIVVNAYRPINPVGGFDPTSVSKDLIGLGGSVAAGLPALTELAMDPTLTEPATEDIVVTGNKAIPKTVVPDELAAVGSVLAGLGIPQVPTPDPALTKKPLGVEDYLSLAGKAVGLLGNIGGGGNQGQTGTYTRGGGSLNPIFSAKLPSASGLGAIGAARTARPLGDQDWLTYGTRPELNFFDYAAQNNPAPVTTPVPGNPAGPIMEERDPMAMAKGGRSTFAVNGPGTGRSDDIPAVLSDGEYVIDAETVALLGDGSSKAGAKKLDDLRVKVRKHKGQKLAKGRFSANAKKPEAYLSGGRI